MKFLDTNVIICFLTDLDPSLRNRAECCLLSGEEYFVPDVIWHEVVYVLNGRFKLQRQPVAHRLIEFMRQPFIAVQGKEALIAAFLSWAETGYDFIDCLLVERAREAGAQGVVSFDSHFSRLGFPHEVPG